jgi:H+/Cl- antiporter ClcA
MNTESSHPRVSEPPQKLVIVIGVGLIFGSTALAAIAGVFLCWEIGRPLAAIVSLGIALFSALVTAQATRSIRRRHYCDDQIHG